MKKKIIVGITAGVIMSCLLGILAYFMDTWETDSSVHKLIRLIIILGWTYVTYNMITLKYKWIRKLAE